MGEIAITHYCLGNGSIGCDGCGREKNWQMLNQMPNALRLALQRKAMRVDDTTCILSGRPWFIQTQTPKSGE